MSIETVRADLAAQGFTGTILEFAESSATVELAAEQAGTTPGRIAKTLAFSSTDPATEPGAILIVAAGDARVNGGLFKREFRAKPRMLAHADVEEATGHAVGGVCPFANPAGARVYLDESLRRFPTVFPAAGSSTSAVELTLEQLEDLSDALGWVDVCAGWREDA
ncbi:YbaK/EbsC family protein [Leucobacter sp. BZR 635]